MKYKFGKAFKKVKKINLEIKNFTKKKHFESLIIDYSKVFDLPRKVVEYETWSILSKNYDYKNSRLLKINSIKNFLKSFFFLITLALLNFFSFSLKKKISKKKEFDLLIDGALRSHEAERFKELSKNFKRVCFISKKKFLEGKNIYHFNFSLFYLSSGDYNLKTRLKFLAFVILIFFYSLISFKNYFFIFFEITYKLLKYNYIFKQVISKSYIQSKTYDTSAIKNYLFKKNGGLVTSCTQQNLLEVGLSSFIYTDIFFTIGENTGKLLQKLDGYCKKNYAVGSLYMESDWFKKRKDTKKIEQTDLLVVGINTVLRHYKLHVTEAFDKNYYKFIEWIKVFSDKFPELKVVIKHHGNFPHDAREAKIIRGSKIKLEVFSNSINGSYANAFKSKVLCSFGSTMIFELLGHNRPGFFIDPNFENQQFFELLPQAKKWRLKTYNEFEKNVLSIINGKKILIKEKKLYCLDSSKVSKKIAKFLKNY